MPETDVFQAIAHPARRRLLDALREGEHPVRELATLFEASRPATSQRDRVGRVPAESAGDRLARGHLVSRLEQLLDTM